LIGYRHAIIFELHLQHSFGSQVFDSFTIHIPLSSSRRSIQNENATIKEYDSTICMKHFCGRLLQPDFGMKNP
jgi:hypothetical protein